MNYDSMTLVELAVEYQRCRDSMVLEELARRDKISQMTHDEKMELYTEEPDPFFEFAKSRKESDTSVVDKLIEANFAGVTEVFNEGFQAGLKAGRRDIAFECLGVSEKDREDEIISRYGANDTGPRDA